MNTELNALLNSAHALATAGRHAEAIPDYQAALRLAPENVDAHYNLHVAYRYINQIQLAFQELDKVAQLSPDDKDVYAARGDLYDILLSSKDAPALQEIISQLPSDTKDHEIFLGIYAYQQAEYGKSLSHFENAVREQPDSAYIQGCMGRALMHLGRYSEAQQVLIAISEDSRVRPGDLYNLAMTERNLRNYAAAVHALERAVQLNDTYFKAWTQLTITELRLGHWRSAWRYFRQSVKCSPEWEKHSKTTA